MRINKRFKVVYCQSCNYQWVTRWGKIVKKCKKCKSVRILVKYYGE